MTRRVNIVLPEATLRTIARVAGRGQRSRFIDQAVQHFVAFQSADALRARLELGAVRDRDLDREVAAEWLDADQQAWRQLDEAERERKPATRGAAKSSSRRSTRR
jgi:CopG family transcriptional regulator/antitoxin EndoAI